VALDVAEPRGYRRRVGQRHGGGDSARGVVLHVSDPRGDRRRPGELGDGARGVVPDDAEPGCDGRRLGERDGGGDGVRGVVPDGANPRPGGDGRRLGERGGGHHGVEPGGEVAPVHFDWLVASLCWSERCYCHCPYLTLPSLPCRLELPGVDGWTKRVS
jgi:hypothetical protein